MAKLAPGVKLLRGLVKAGRTQQRAVSRMLAAAAPKQPAKAPLTIRPHTRPATEAAPGKWLTGQFSLPASQRMNYWLYLPQQVPDAVAGSGWPLVVMLHGCHQSATQFAQGTRMNLLAEDKGFAVLYPQQSLGVQAQRCWRWYEQATQQGAGETAVLAALIEKVCTQHAMDRHRIYACGISAGAGMAAVLALNHPELIAAVGLHSGPVFGAGHNTVGALHVMRHGAPGTDAVIHDLLRGRAEGAQGKSPMPPMPAILIHGENDRVVHSINQQQLARQWLQLNGLPYSSVARVTVKPAAKGGRSNAHEISDYLMGRKVILRVARIAGLGHAWSGGDPALKFNEKAGPSASRMMLDFFSKHRR